VDIKKSKIIHGCHVFILENKPNESKMVYIKNYTDISQNVKDKAKNRTTKYIRRKYRRFTGEFSRKNENPSQPPVDN
jgi:hypothetical protein